MSAAETQLPSLSDCTEWPLTLSVQAYGVSVGVRVNDPEVAEEVARHLPPGSKRTEFFDTGRTYSLLIEKVDPPREPRHSVFVNDALLGLRLPLPTLLRVFESDLQIYVAEMAPDYVFVHAGVIGYRGRGILLPARSFAGKTTLVAELVKAGAEYYSDEYAVLDADGHVHPYPRALSIRQGAGRGVKKQSVDALGGQAGHGPLPVGLVVVCKFRADAEWNPQRLSPGNGALALLANTISARRIPEIVMATLNQVVSVAPVLSSERGEASGVVQSILDLATWS